MSQLDAWYKEEKDMERIYKEAYECNQCEDIDEHISKCLKIKSKTNEHTKINK